MVANANAISNENFLTSPILEKVRLLEQIDHDDSDASSNKVILMVPIVSILKDLDFIGDSLKTYDISEDKLENVRQILFNSKYSTAFFKKTFNRYSDNIFYSDSDRANLYLAGGAIPTSRQTQLYLLRNDILTSIENLRDDILSMKGQVIEKQDIDDALSDLKTARDSLLDYLSLSDPNDVKLAKEILN